MKQFVLKDAVVSGAQACTTDAVRSLSAVHPSTGCRWLASEMAAFRASSKLSFGASMTLGLALDATRLGRPAKEILCGFVTNASKQIHAPLPPQALIAQILAGPGAH